MNAFAIEASELKKSFGGRPALNGLSLRVPAGSIAGFLGVNGAGKTTAIKVLMGMLRAGAGAARVLGFDAGDPAQSIEARRRIGCVAEDKELYPFMTVEQILRFTRPFFPRWRDDLVRRHLKLFHLPPRRKVADLSKGMRSKLMLLLAVCHGAELLILDEPTDGLDPLAVDGVLRELVTTATGEGAAIFFSSHHLNEVEQIADRICLIDRGRAVVEGVLDDLKTRCHRLQVVLEQEPAAPVRWRRARAARRADHEHSCERKPGRHRGADRFAARRFAGAIPGHPQGDFHRKHKERRKFFGIRPGLKSDGACRCR